MIEELFIRLIADWLVVPIVLIAGIAMLRLPKDKRWPMIGRGVVAGLLALAIAKIAALFYQGERPFTELGVEPKAAFLNNPGFPSDHTLLVFTITLVIWASTKNKPLSAALLTMSTLVATGRVLGLVHTPIDVAGGVVFAGLAALIVYRRRLLP